MTYTEYESRYRLSAIELMCQLQEHERAISNDRPPASEVSAAQLDYLVLACARAVGKIFIALDAERVVGLIVVFLDHEHEGTQHVYEQYRQFGLVTDFVVAETHRGSGVASELLSLAEGFCKSLSLSIIKLSVLRANEVARRFYEKRGYEAHEVVYRKTI
ncbi:GNAT family N-acetyltransferase [Marinobacter sp. F4216]|uniref:GNAT family N-acetyltransferase n=1 Tax=Marinobacter sp. F4216 TaxID=2874281 RepID=UPI001CBE4600|nr:GNAT family N-acetyltransferase [Marinobacter sp. F4216]MBZ2168648.1 GNAT family N-acetyltransferase [Marinobacter sp. F4216]